MNRKSGEESGEGCKTRFSMAAADPQSAFAVDRGTSFSRPPPNGLEGDCKGVLSPNRAWGQPESVQGRVGALCRFAPSILAGSKTDSGIRGGLADLRNERDLRP